MILVIVIYVTLINLTEMECILLLLKSCLFMCFRIFNFCQIKMIFREDKSFKKIFIANVNVYRYSNFIKTDKILEQTAVLL